jgi:hypothetical protein
MDTSEKHNKIADALCTATIGCQPGSLSRIEDKTQGIQEFRTIKKPYLSNF